MPVKRKFCGHCGEFVSERTYRRHSEQRKPLESSSDEEENGSLVGQLNQDGEIMVEEGEQDTEQDDERPVPGMRKYLHSSAVE